MPQKYALYFNRKALLFNNLQDIQTQADKAEHIIGSTENTLLAAIETLKASKNEHLKIFLPGISQEDGLKLLKNKFKFLVAAGGVVISPEREILAIYRLGCWDLPKGKVEESEDIEDAAEREIIEETGIPAIHQRSFLTKTYHSYELKGHTIIKETWWYSFKSKEKYSLTPQHEEDITEAKWIPLSEIDTILKNTYPSIEDVLQKYLEKGFIS